jgi:cellulose synthase/poly-beta-1,6-N-acetylglucosamine synthase-like glycosyltransferase
METTETIPQVAVVVIGRNEGERLTRCLESIRAASYPQDAIDVVYVDSDSRDDSVERARRLGANVIVVHPERPSAALGRNAGWRATSAPFVLFLDGDTILDPEFITVAMKSFEKANCAVVFGHRRELYPEQSIYNRVFDLDWVSPIGRSDYCGGDALMRRSVLEEVGGYDATLIAGEEPELCQRIRSRGYTVLHIDQPMTGHDLAIHRFGQYWKRAFRTGFAYAEIAERFADTKMPLWTHEANVNAVHALGVIGVASTSLVASIAFVSMTPLVLFGLAFAAIAVRTAHRASWKGGSLATRIAYAVHSHFQQVPIYFGQLCYRRSKRGGRRQSLIEYKEPRRTRRAA